MPPTIQDAVVLGPLNPTERKVLQLINTKPNHIWSRRLADLTDLAAWAEFPRSADAPHNVKPIGGPPISMNSKLEVKYSKETSETPTLRTIATALRTLAEGERIWAGELYGTLYYGNKNVAFMGIEQELKNLGQAQLEKANFKTLTLDGISNISEPEPEIE